MLPASTPGGSVTLIKRTSSETTSSIQRKSTADTSDDLMATHHEKRSSIVSNAPLDLTQHSEACRSFKATFNLKPGDDLAARLPEPTPTLMPTSAPAMNSPNESNSGNMKRVLTVDSFGSLVKMVEGTVIESSAAKNTGNMKRVLTMDSFGPEGNFDAHSLPRVSSMESMGSIGSTGSLVKSRAGSMDSLAERTRQKIKAVGAAKTQKGFGEL